MKIELSEVKETEKAVLHQLMELYLYDFSEFNEADVDDQGFYGYTFFDTYWIENTRHPFFIKVNGRFAGFVLVNSYCNFVKDPDAKSIAEFFVMRKYRRQGIGRVIALKIFDLFPGKWEVVQQEKNALSQKFWENVVRDYMNGNFSRKKVKTELWAGQVLLFDNAPKVSHQE